MTGLKILTVVFMLAWVHTATNRKHIEIFFKPLLWAQGTLINLYKTVKLSKKVKFEIICNFELSKLFTSLNSQNSHHSVHESHKTPKRVYFVGQQNKYRRQKVAHALHIAQVKVVHDVRHQDIVQERDVGVVLSFEEWVRSVRAIHILFWNTETIND